MISACHAETCRHSIHVLIVMMLMLVPDMFASYHGKDPTATCMRFGMLMQA